MLDEGHVDKVSEKLGIKAHQIRAAADLLDGGATIPFIARYRKEATGSLDEVVITTIRDSLEALRELDKRRGAILKTLEESGRLTGELKEKILAAEGLSVLEDIYLPYRPKRRTRASVAREKGLEPLARAIFDQDLPDMRVKAAEFVDADKGVESVEDALAGARDIIAEWISEDEKARAAMRHLFFTKGMLRSKVGSGKEEEGTKFKDYFDWEEPLAKAPSHRILAMRRGENEEVLILRMTPPEEDAVALLEGMFVKGRGEAAEQVRMAVVDGYKRLLSFSMETEIRLETKKRADEEAIRVFQQNLRQLLLAPPLGQKTVLAIDPGFRTGCKVVCLDGQGKLFHTETIFPHQGPERAAAAEETVKKLCERFGVQAIAIGNGTAGRETEAFIGKLGLSREIQVVMVNESGASVYSASEVAREEFPDQDVTVRGAVSIGRRLIDPLAELVKIDPKSIGVGQYQHDVDQRMLKRSLDDVVESCVNRVGVEVNTASKELLTYVSGLGPQLAGNIVKHRNENGAFAGREGLKRVAKLGPRAFEQAAGFLRIRGAKNPLDATAVHPERYQVVERMASDLDASAEDLIRDAGLRARIDIKRYVSDSIGLPTLQDILAELEKPGRDPREGFEAVVFAEGIDKIEDLRAGMELPGVVTNITGFGAFVDIGVHQDGL
ncbi:MAG TPA: RNA-binding transcriptional accessory protein, partial [Deltaproteobacteria bacterium]|nr:RNA-binding transcriptional accessory protein [Deltaproteobacteria bacterium]